MQEKQNSQTIIQNNKETSIQNIVEENQKINSQQQISKNSIEEQQKSQNQRRATNTQIANSKVFGSINNNGNIQIVSRKTGLESYKTQQSQVQKNKEKQLKNQEKQRKKLEELQKNQKNQLFTSVKLTENEIYKLNFLQKFIRLILGIVSSFAIACDIILIIELWDFKEKREISGSWDYQFYIMLCITIFTCVIGHCLGNQQPMEQGSNQDYPKYKIGKILFRFFGLVGLSPIIYFWYSSFTGKASKQQDDYCMLQLGPRRWWAHWQSILSCFISSHFMYTTGEHTNWVVVGFIMNSCNACLSFIEYTGYTDQLDQNHRYCEDCKCNEDLMKYTKEFPFPYKNFIVQCKFCKSFFEDKEDFLYCGCKKHMICLHKQCKKIAQKKDKDNKTIPYDHRFQKPLYNFMSKNYQYFLMFPEIFARPLFFGITALITIENSNFTDTSPVKLTYDFFIWDAIIMFVILVLPYMVFILLKDSQNIRPASILIFYTFYYSQILRVPFREYTLLQYNQQLLLMSFIKQESQNIDNNKQLNQIYEVMKKQLKLDQFNGIVNIMEEQLNLDLLITAFPHIISFLGYFPAIWRLGEFLALFTIVIVINFGDVTEQAETKNVQNITSLTIFWNLFAILSLGFSIIEFTKIRKRIIKINKDWKQKGEIYQYYTNIAQKSIERKKQQHRNTILEMQSIFHEKIDDIDNEKAADYIYQNPKDFSNIVHSVNTEIQRKATKQSSSQESGVITQQQRVVQSIDILDKNLNEYQDVIKEEQTLEQQQIAKEKFFELKGAQAFDKAFEQIYEENSSQNQNSSKNNSPNTQINKQFFYAPDSKDDDSQMLENVDEFQQNSAHSQNIPTNRQQQKFKAFLPFSVKSSNINQ